MSFSFNFVPNTKHTSDSVAMDTSKEGFTDVGGKQPQNRSSSFAWVDDYSLKEELQNDAILLSPGRQEGVGTTNDYVLRVREESASFRDRNTDLVPGVYEGGLKVWECSLDMCRYFLSHDINIEGHVLELGCGHGLPGIFLLKQAIARSERSRNAIECFVTFSDYNEFVIRDVTIPNVVINARDAYSNRTNSVGGPENIEHWLRQHTAFGAGDWFDGLYDCILASETTYSETSAKETAELLSRHLKPGKGVAFISTKRYYFGVAGVRNVCAMLYTIS
eukprot:jgi/Psemu1/36680/gm1.36680_g